MTAGVRPPRPERATAAMKTVRAARLRLLCLGLSFAAFAAADGALLVFFGRRLARRELDAEEPGWAGPAVAGALLLTLTQLLLTPLLGRLAGPRLRRRALFGA